jgi:hypothetical protein
MTKKQRNEIIKWASTLTDDQLENEYYDAVYDSLGSQTEEMYELGYDIADILEREEHEDYLDKRTDLLGRLCEERGIKLWEKYGEPPAYEASSFDEIDEIFTKGLI